MLKTSAILLYTMGATMGLMALLSHDKSKNYRLASNFSSSGGFDMNEIQKARKRNQKRKRRH